MMSDIAENPDFENLLFELFAVLSDEYKTEVTLMMLNVVAVAADGRRDIEELENFRWRSK